MLVGGFWGIRPPSESTCRKREAFHLGGKHGRTVNSSASAGINAATVQRKHSFARCLLRPDERQKLEILVGDFF